MNSSSDSALGEEEPRSSTATSRTLLDRVKDDDAAAWDRMVGLYAPWCIAGAGAGTYRSKRSPTSFRTCFRPFRRISATSARRSSADTFRGWLRTIAHNKVRDHFRKLGREPGGAGGTDAQIRWSSVAAARLPDDDDSGGEDAVPWTLSSARST